MPTPRSGRHRRNNPSRPAVFLNLPYDRGFESLFLAYIAGVSAFGMTPRATLEIPGSVRRLDRIFELLSSCSYSIHDLSRVQLDRSAPATPRFNMPFELGLAVAHEKSRGNHIWFVFESMDHRIMKSLSDLNGTDPYIHNGRLDGVFAQIGNAFLRTGPQPTVPRMRTIYRGLRASVPGILHETGSNSLFAARAFQELSAVAVGLADEVVLARHP